MSSGPFMYIEFMSDRHKEKQGFHAEFEFLDEDGIIGPHNGKWNCKMVI